MGLDYRQHYRTNAHCTDAHITQHHEHSCIFSSANFCLPNPSLVNVPSLLWEQIWVTTRAVKYWLYHKLLPSSATPCLASNHSTNLNYHNSLFCFLKIPIWAGFTYIMPIKGSFIFIVSNKSFKANYWFIWNEVSWRSWTIFPVKNLMRALFGYLDSRPN